MQQLSLFDFGEEAPKPEKKKKSSESSVEHTDSTTDKDNNSETETEDTPITGKGKSPLLDDQDSQDEQTSSPIPTPPLPPSSENLPEEATEPEQSANESEGDILEKEDEKAEENPPEAIENAQFPVQKPEKELNEEHSASQAQNQPPAQPASEAEVAPNGLHHPPSNGQDKEAEKMSPTDSIGSNNDTKQTEKDSVFSNDQIGVKKVTIKAINPEGINAAGSDPSENDIPAGTSHGQQQAGEKESSSALDTSFSSDEFDSISDPKAGDTRDGTIENEPSEAPEEEITLAPAIEDSATQDSDAPVKSESEPVDNEEIYPNNTHKKPYYIEDQTIPVRKRGRKSFKEIDAEVDLINIPPDEELFQKQYYPISVVAKWFRVNNSLLRFWENEFKILKPKKNKKGDRFFRPEDVKNLQLIYYLLRQKKLTINGAIKHLKSYKEQTEVNMQLIQTLNEFKGFLLELRAATEK